MTRSMITEGTSKKSMKTGISYHCWKSWWKNV